jgi:phage shock protein C
MGSARVGALGCWPSCSTGGCGIRCLSSRPVAFQRSRKQKMIAGVCGGIAEWLGWDPTIVRVLYVVVSILSAAFPGMLVYVVLWVVIPRAPE